MFKSIQKRTLTALFCLFCIGLSFTLTAKPKDTDQNESKGIYKKYVSPREYIFDLADSKSKVTLKYDQESGKAYCNVDFTDLVKEQMPRKGDKVTFTYEGSSSRDLQSITATVYDLTKGQNIGNKVPEIFTTAIGKKQTFKKTFSLLLTADAEKSISLHLIATLPENSKKVDKIDLSFKRVTQSTNTKKEAEEEKEAVKKGLKVVRVKSNFTVVEKKVEVKTADEPEEKKEELPVQENKTPKSPITILENPAADKNVNNDNESNDTTPSNEQETLNISDENEDLQEELEVESEPVEEILVVEEIVIEDDISILPEILEEPSVFEEVVEDLKEEEVPEEVVEEVPEKVIIKVEPVVSVNVPKKEEKVEVKSSESTYEPIIVKSKVSRYAKEYLQDYSVNDDLELNDNETETIKIIENPDKKDKRGKTLLMLAAEKGDKNRIKELLYSGADVNLKDNEGWTALMYAARYQSDLSCLDLIIDANANIKDKNKYGLSPLILASCYNSNPQILERLIKYYSPSDKEVLKAFTLMLSESSISDKIQIEKTKIYIDYSIPINAFYEGKTPLMYAAEYCNSTKIIRLLIENNAITNLRSSEGKSAFDYAGENINLEHDNVYWTLNIK